MFETLKNSWPAGQDRPAIVPVIRLFGPIGSDGQFSNNLNMSNVGGLLEAAFSTRRASAVALVINSPGGTPAQSALIHRRIRALADEKSLPVFAFVEDVAASGGYMIACAADEIYADPFSVVGSIGVRMDGFGLHNVLEKLGVERRLYSAGANKARLDPFKPEDPADVDWVHDHLREVHRLFIEMVTARRGEALTKAGDTDLFTGDFWHGEQALGLGLIDGIGDVRSVLRERFGETVATRVLVRRRPWWESMVPFSRDGDTPAVLTSAPDLSGGLDLSNAGVGLVDPDAAVRTLATRSLWARYGL